MSSVGSLTYGCDANGNLISGNQTAVAAAYDAKNQPLTVTRVASRNGNSIFGYGPEGQLYGESGSDGYITYWSGSGLVLTHSTQ